MNKFASAILLTGISAAIRVTCIGDSITEGGDKTLGSPSYCGMLPALLGSDYQVFNAGKSAMTMLKTGLENDGSPHSYWDTQAWIDA